MMPVFQYETLTLNVIMQQQLHQQVKPVKQQQQQRPFNGL